MQFRMSPGGRMLKSSRRRPDEPPSSVTVTTAQRSPMMGQRSWGSTFCSFPASWCRTLLRRSCMGTKCFRPRSRVDSPVPPPMATTRNDLSLVPVELDEDKGTSQGRNCSHVSRCQLSKLILRTAEGCFDEVDSYAGTYTSG